MRSRLISLKRYDILVSAKSTENEYFEHELFVQRGAINKQARKKTGTSVQEALTEKGSRGLQKSSRKNLFCIC